MSTIDLSDFIVLELLRMKRVTKEELNEMKLFFDELDVEQTGEIDLQRTRYAFTIIVYIIVLVIYFYFINLKLDLDERDRSTKRKTPV